MSYVVRFTRGAEQNLLRLFDFLLEKDLASARRAHAAIMKSIGYLSLFPHSCRRAEGCPADVPLRELLIPFANAGYVFLFEIENADTVTILAVRHQREEDYQP